MSICGAIKFMISIIKCSLSNYRSRLILISSLQGVLVTLVKHYNGQEHGHPRSGVCLTPIYRRAVAIL